MEDGAAVTNLAIRLQELDDVELEEFVELWAEQRQKAYVEVLRIGGAHDKARDVIGFRSPSRHEGDWDLYQCKRKTLRSKLGKSEALVELAKMVFHHVDGAYATLPVNFYFVSPRGVVGTLLDLFTHPSRLKQALLDEWDAVCSTKIVQGKAIDLSAEIKATISGYDFARVSHFTAPGIVKDPAAKAALVQILKELPGEAPGGVAPVQVAGEEREYLDQLRVVYEQASGQAFSSIDAVLGDARYRDHLRDQRTRYFEAEAFKRFHRDNTDKQLVVQFENDIYHGVVDVHREPCTLYIERLTSVMKHASNLNAAIVGRAVRIPVKQGICHHLANEGRLKWTS
ncbi:ABC-three component system protein [Caulobacter sp. Root1472]|uniref:ABC-three component system protein n=1 Tax=Caulobacter sp. Root1472 TaxID=1736470 RepID=UPI0006F49A8D|nr:ABC-three component system protein [Caulobacter sp. Root1472]KQZ29328.1 hypothetical protein ASD47_18880 [Caulobacter sp. Root1472]